MNAREMNSIRPCESQAPMASGKSAGGQRGKRDAGIASMLRLGFVWGVRLCGESLVP